jgi:hypothetical protein
MSSIEQRRLIAPLFVHRPVTRRLINLYPPTNCRVKRHFETPPTHKHGRPAETKPDKAIRTYHANTREAKPIQGPKLYSKVPTKQTGKHSLTLKGKNVLIVIASPIF